MLSWNWNHSLQQITTAALSTLDQTESYMLRWAKTPWGLTHNHYQIALEKYLELTLTAPYLRITLPRFLVYLELPQGTTELFGQ